MMNYENEIYIKTENVSPYFNAQNSDTLSVLRLLHTFYGVKNPSSYDQETIIVWEHALTHILKNQKTAPHVLNLVFNNLPADFMPSVAKFREIAGQCQKIVYEQFYEHLQRQRALQRPVISEEQKIKNLEIINEKIKRIFGTKKF